MLNQACRWPDRADTFPTFRKHAALLRRVAAAVGSDAKLTSFKLSVRAYKGSETSAQDLVDQLWNIFGKDQEVCSGVVTSLAELLEGDQRTGLLAAWRDHRTEVRGPRPLGARKLSRCLADTYSAS